MGFWKENFFGVIIKNVLIAVLILLVLGWITLFAIDKYTQHNVVETVPDVRGMSIGEAISMLEANHLYLEVIDSMFVKNKPLGYVLEQTPVSGSKVKPNRPIYLVINSLQVRKIPLPDILETSYRQATASLQSVGMSVQQVKYIDSEYKDLVLSIEYRGNVIRPGARIPDGSGVTLVVGRGLGNVQSGVPSLKGMTSAQATDVLVTAGFTLGTVEVDPHSQGDASSFIIYRQRPAAGRNFAQGSHVDVWLTSDKTLLSKPSETNDDDEEFF